MIDDVAAGGRRDKPFVADAGWLAAIWGLAAAYDFVKPYHMDDTSYLEVSQWIVGHPLHPLSGLLNWGGLAPMWRAQNSPGYAFVMALWGRLFGWAEPSMHALQALAALACVILMYRLARAVAPRSALWATALVILGPAFIVEMNAMVDTPLLALWLAFFNLIVCGGGSARQHRRYALAALACGAAILVKYSGLVLEPMLALSIVMERRWRQAWTLLIPVAVVVGWSAYNLADYGGVHILGRGAFISPSLNFVLSWVAALGGLTPLGWVALARARPRWAPLAPLFYAVLAALAVSLAAVVAFGVVGDRVSDAILRGVFLASGLLVSAALAPDAWPLIRPSTWTRPVPPGAAPALYLMLWILGASAFYILFAPFVAARHLLLILPPTTLLIVRRWGERMGAADKVFALGMTLALSAGLCLSDWRFAAFYCDEAPVLARAYPPAAGARFAGSWGWQWYAKQAGFRQIDQFSTFHDGDILIAPTEGPAPGPAGAAKAVRADTQGAPLLNLICSGRIARLYTSDQSGPWSLSRHCTVGLTVYRLDLAAHSGPDGL